MRGIWHPKMQVAIRLVAGLGAELLFCHVGQVGQIAGIVHFEARQIALLHGSLIDCENGSEVDERSSLLGRKSVIDRHHCIGDILCSRPFREIINLQADIVCVLDSWAWSYASSSFVVPSRDVVLPALLVRIDPVLVHGARFLFSGLPALRATHLIQPER